MDSQYLKKGTSLQNGKYTVIDVLGQGGFGITYKAMMKETASGKLGAIEIEVAVAIKEFFMKESCVRSDSSYVSVPSTGSKATVEQYRRKFVKEANNLAGLSHPNIVKVIDVFNENGTDYYVMEYLEGGSLKDYVKKNGRADEAEAMRFVSQVADALSYMHTQRHMCHYDVKPGNILLDKHGVAKLIDFGISKGYDEEGNETSSTPVGISRGYAPMEQYTQKVQAFSPQSDVYALAATTYFLLTGLTPPDALEIFQNNWAPTLPESISGNIRKAIAQGMKSHKSERPQSIKDFIAMLQGITTDDGDVTFTSEKESKREEIKTAKKEEPKQPRNIVLTLPLPKHFIWKPLAALASLAVLVILIVVFANRGGGDEPSEIDTLLVSVDEENKKLDEEIKKTILQKLIYNMVRIEGGTFMMGATSEQGSNADGDEKPAHQVTLSSFSIGKYEVTQEEWEAVMGSNPSNFKGAKRPVEKVSWNDCQEFIRKLNELTGRSFRLPTEAEWEYAARGGNKSIGYKYAGGDNLGSVAWYGDNSGNETHDVGMKLPNELGLYDMSGNVSEWCQDWKDSYSSSAQTNPKGPSSGSSRMNRGGSWRFSARGCRVSYRGGGAPDFTSSSLGFRLAL